MAAGILVGSPRRLIQPLRRWIAEPGQCPPGWRIGPPSFVGVGAQRSGTQWWYGLVTDHPRIRGVAAVSRRLHPLERADPGSTIPTTRQVPVRRELHFFDSFAERPFEHRDVALYHRFFPRADGELAGEWTPRYMLDFWTPRLLQRAAPAAKVLVLLRDPIERYRSGLSSAVPVARGRGVPLAWNLLNDAVLRSLYAPQLRRLLRRFDTHQVLVLQYERCCRDPAAELERTYRFLGVDPSHRPGRLGEQAGPKRPKPELPADVRQDLVTTLVDDVREVIAHHPEIDIELWPNFRDAV